MDDNFAIQLFEGKKVRIVWDEEKEKYYSSPFPAETHANTAAKEITALRRSDELNENRGFSSNNL